MDYTQSDSFHTHTATGQRMHKELQAVPTAWSDRDANSVIWSLMEVLRAGGVAGVQFDPDVPSSYQALLQAIQNLNAASSSDLPGRVSIFLQPTAPPGWIKANGALLSRVTYGALWGHVQTVGAVSEAVWAAGQHAWFSSGDGATTFRVPDLRGIFIRGLDDGRGLDPGRLIGSFQDSANKSHAHGIVDPTHTHGKNDPGHVHSGGMQVNAAGGHAASGAPNFVDNVNTGSATTGITILAAATGITIQPNGDTESRGVNGALPWYIKY